MTVNIAFKTPDALVFATDGLATVMNVDSGGDETFLSNVENVEKLVLLSNDGTRPAPILAMFNGVGSLGAGSVATELRAIDRLRPRRHAETMVLYMARIARELENTTLARLRTLPRPFHLILAGFDLVGGRRSSPSVQAFAVAR